MSILTMTANATKLKMKKENWTSEEVEVLLQEVDNRKSILFGRLSATVTNERKRLQWKETVAAINAVSLANRTEAETIKKWRNIKSKIKSKEGERQQERKKTGGGESSIPDDPTPIEQKVLGIIGKVCVSGIPQGVDSAVVETVHSEDEDDDSQPPVTIKNNPQPPVPQPSSSTQGAEVLSDSDGEDHEENDVPSPPRKRKCRPTSASERLVEIEEGRLKIEKERLEIEKERLQIEKKRLQCEEKRLKLEEKRQSCSTTTGRSLIDNANCTYFDLQ